MNMESLITSLSVILYNWFNLVDALQQRSHLFDLNDEHRLTVSFVGWTEVFFFPVGFEKTDYFGSRSMWFVSGRHVIF